MIQSFQTSYVFKKVPVFPCTSAICPPQHCLLRCWNVEVAPKCAWSEWITFDVAQTIRKLLDITTKCRAENYAPLPINSLWSWPTREFDGAKNCKKSNPNRKSTGGPLMNCLHYFRIISQSNSLIWDFWSAVKFINLSFFDSEIH